MKSTLLIITLLLLPLSFIRAQADDHIPPNKTDEQAAKDDEQPTKPRKQLTNSFDHKTRIFSFALGFPNLYRVDYEEPAGYTHIKTTGFGPIYAKFEIAATDAIGIVPAFGYSTFHYSYYGWAYFPGYQQQVIYYDDVNTLHLSLSANYHFNQWITNPHIDLYAGVGIAMNYLRYRYGNIPPYREPESKTQFRPLGRVGLRYYFDATFGVFAEAGYDGFSVGQLGISVRF